MSSLTTRSRSGRAAIAFALLTASAAALAAPPAGFDQRVEALRKTVGVPGISIAIVEGGDITLSKGYGVRRVGAAQSVTSRTIFPNGSTGKASSARSARVGPSLPLARYAGDYQDPWYGPMSIRSPKGKLRVDFKQSPGMTGTLEHWQYDSFRTRWDDKSFEPAYVTFGLGAGGTVERITMKAVSPAADFSWDYHDLLFTPAGLTR